MMVDEGKMHEEQAYLEANERLARRVAREEIASLCGLVLRRLQDTESPEMVVGALAAIFGEALRDFTTDKGPGDE